MNDENKTKDQIISEISELREQIAELERLEVAEIIEHQQALKALQQSEDKFYKAFHCYPDIITISTFNEGRYIEVNEAYLILVGYEIDEVIGRTVDELGIWDDPQERKRVLAEIKIKGSIRNYEMLFQTKTKELITALISVDLIDIGGEAHLLFVGKDISDRKIMEEALRLSEERFAKAFNASPITMSISTVEDGRFLDVNDSFCRTLGSNNREQILGRTSLEIGFWVDLLDRQKVKQSIINNVSVSNMEIQFRKICGDIKLGLYSAERVDINGEICILSLFHDLTEQRQLEIEISRLERLNLVGEMAASIGHEIRNPMTTVRGYLQILRENHMEDIVCFDLMIEEMDSANEIITEFLSLAKNKTMELKKVNLNAILKSVFPLLQANAVLQDKAIILVMEEVPDLLLDENEIRQLILNLVNNGLDAIPAGKIVQINTFMENINVVLSVQDQGSGISQETLEKIGTPFYTTKKSAPGLGLAVCYGIAARHQAKINIQTGSSGTRFQVRFKNNYL